MRSIVIIAHDIRSTHNVGSLLRTAEGIGVTKVYLTGYTPYPISRPDERLPYIAEKLHRAIQKTALGAEILQPWEHVEDVRTVLKNLKEQGYHVFALEQSHNSVALPDFNAPEKCAVLLGSEVTGVEKSLLDLCEGAIEIPMFGKKESFNVIQAAAMLLYELRF